MALASACAVQAQNFVRTEYTNSQYNAYLSNGPNSSGIDLDGNGSQDINFRCYYTTSGNTPMAICRSVGGTEILVTNRTTPYPGTAADAEGVTNGTQVSTASIPFSTGGGQDIRLATDFSSELGRFYNSRKNLVCKLNNYLYYIDMRFTFVSQTTGYIEVFALGRSYIQGQSITAGDATTPMSATFPFAANGVVYCGSNSGEGRVMPIGGGAPPYTYNWSNGSTATVATGLAANQSYSVTVTDSRADFVTLSFFTMDFSPTIGAIVTPACNGTNGSVSVSAPASAPTAPFDYLWSNGATTQTINNLTPGLYTCTATPQGGTPCVLSVSLGAVVAVANYDMSTGLLGSSNSTTSGAATYQWLLNGNPIANATASTYRPTQNGSYSLRLTSGGCTNTSSAVNVILSSIFGAENDAFNARLFPNPTSSSINIQSEQSELIETVSVYGMTGQMLQNHSFSELANGELSLHALPAGMYMIVLRGNDNAQSRYRVVKQ